jgi:hypothetical protein
MDASNGDDGVNDPSIVRVSRIWNAFSGEFHHGRCGPSGWDADSRRSRPVQAFAKSGGASTSFVGLGWRIQELLFRIDHDSEYAVPEPSILRLGSAWIAIGVVRKAKKSSLLS